MTTLRFIAVSILLVLLVCNSAACSPVTAKGFSFSLSDTSAINGLNRSAAALADRQQFDSAHSLIQQAITLSEGSNYRLGRTQAESNLARIYYMKGDYVRSLKFGLSSLRLAEQLNDKAEIALCKNLVGLVHLVRGEHQLALQEFLY